MKVNFGSLDCIVFLKREKTLFKNSLDDYKWR